MVISQLSRRRFLQSLAASPLVAGSWTAAQAAAQPRRIRVAALLTSFFYRSHAHVILENFLVPYLFNGNVIDPTQEFELASFYVDQFPDGTDMARDVARQFGIPIHRSVTEALCLGGSELSVDAVLLIGEHGTYPFNDKGQELYPKKKFFDEVVTVFERSGRTVPVYNDKHLSHTWDEALEMHHTAQRMGFGLMAGSSVPLAERRPPQEIPPDARISEAVSIHGGPLERYGFHGLEVLQSMIEARRGGETGIDSVRYVEGDELWRTAEQGLWSAELARVAMQAEVGPEAPPLRQLIAERFSDAAPHAFLVNSTDGTRAAVLKIGNSGIRWNFACHITGQSEPLATRFHVGPWQNRNLFKALAHAIQDHFRNNLAPYPVERTLLTTGALEAAVNSHVQGGATIRTPHLNLAYAPRDFRSMRENGATWKIITEDLAQPPGIEPVKIPTPPPSSR